MLRYQTPPFATPLDEVLPGHLWSTRLGSTEQQPFVYFFLPFPDMIMTMRQKMARLTSIVSNNKKNDQKTRGRIPSEPVNVNAHTVVDGIEEGPGMALSAVNQVL
jgi:hypothetical protein